MEPHIRQSLTEAGIGSRYHDKKLTEIGNDGKELWNKLHGSLRRHVKSGSFLSMEGYERETIMTFAKTLHINGVGVQNMAVSKLWTIMQHPSSERWENVRDAPMLILNPAQAERDCPLVGWQMDIVEEYLLSRLEARKSLTFALSNPLSADGWWSAEFIRSVRQHLVPLASAQSDARTQLADRSAHQ